jgi:hypothetical protein
MFASSPAEVTPRVRPSISCKKSWLHSFHGKRPTDFGYSTEKI